MRTRLAPIALACLSSVLAFAADPSSPPKAPASPAAIAKAPAPAAPAATAAKTGTITGRVTGADAKPLAGAVVIRSKGEVVGAIGASGAPGGDKDESCARAGIEKIKDRLPQ